jgi:hypothetical protein
MPTTDDDVPESWSGGYVALSVLELHHNIA